LLYLDVDKKAFGMYGTRKKVKCKAYERGKLVAEFNINNKAERISRRGITAAQIFLKEAERTETNTIRNRILLAMTIDQVNIHDIYFMETGNPKMRLSIF
jgi:hypothetical protein